MELFGTDIQAISESTANIEEEYIKTKICEHEKLPVKKWKDNLIGFVDFSEYELHLHPIEFSTMTGKKCIYSKRYKKYICCYKVAQETIMKGNDVHIRFWIEEYDLPENE